MEWRTVSGIQAACEFGLAATAMRSLPDDAGLAQYPQLSTIPDHRGLAKPARLVIAKGIATELAHHKDEIYGYLVIALWYLPCRAWIALSIC